MPIILWRKELPAEGYILQGKQRQLKQQKLKDILKEKDSQELKQCTFNKVNHSKKAEGIGKERRRENKEI